MSVTFTKESRIFEVKKPVIAVDFDGTLCKNAFPLIGYPNEMMIDFIRFEKAKGSKIILWTCREGESLKEAVRWCADWGIEFDAVNENLPERIAHFNNDPRKIGADVYIDDKAIGAFWGGCLPK